MYDVSKKVDGIVVKRRGTEGDCKVPRSVRAVVPSDEVKGTSQAKERRGDGESEKEGGRGGGRTESDGVVQVGCSEG